MFWIIFIYVLSGLATLHLIRIKKADEKNPNLSLWEILCYYWRTDRFEILISVVGLFVFTSLLNLGLAPLLASTIFGLGNLIDTSTPWGIRAVGYLIGIAMQGVIMWFAKRKTNSLERTLERKQS